MGVRHLLIPFLLAMSACASGGPRGGTPRFAWPVHSGRITQNFKNGYNRHDGLDISGKKNDPVYAAESGRVLYAGKDFNGYGNLLIIEHDGDRWASFYGHLNGFNVREGAYVRRGQEVAKMGATGRASGVHLHFEIRHNLRPVDPLNFLGPNRQLSQR